jgi:hypothetical protein
VWLHTTGAGAIDPAKACSGNNKTTLVGHSTGGEPARYIGRDGNRVVGRVLRRRKDKESKDV